MAELMAQLDGPVYVERVALFDAKNRVQAEKAITKALRLQVENRGFSFVEVLAECPTHLQMTPRRAERWVKEKMLPVFPLGVKKDDVPEPWPLPPAPSFLPGQTRRRRSAERARRSPRFCDGFPKHAPGATDIAHEAGRRRVATGPRRRRCSSPAPAINEGFDATHIPSYGPESRGGTSYADVHIAEEEVLSPGGARTRTSSWPSTRRASRSSGPRCRKGASSSTTAR